MPPEAPEPGRISRGGALKPHARSDGLEALPGWDAGGSSAGTHRQALVGAFKANLGQ